MDWHQRHDAASLNAIREHRESLIGDASSDSPDVKAALCLARLIDIEGASREIEGAITNAIVVADGGDKQRLQYALSQLDYESGRLDRANERLIQLSQASTSVEVEALCHLSLARLAVLSGEEASTHLDAARSVLRRTDDSPPWVEAFMHSVRANLALQAGRKSDAQQSWGRALDLALGYDGAVEASIAAGCLGNLALDLGDLPSAHSWFSQAVELSKRVGATTVEATFSGYRAWCLHIQGERVAAEHEYTSAITLCENVGLRRFRAHFESLRASLRATGDAIEAEELVYRRALNELRQAGDIERTEALSVLQVVFECRRAERAGAGRESQRRLIHAFDSLHAAAANSDDARIARRQASATFSASAKSLHVESVALKLDPWQGTGSGPSGAFDLRQHPTVQRLLWTLVVAWTEERAATDEELINATWPNEQIIESAARRRLQVGISTLRKEVFGDALSRSEGGYRINVDSISLRPHTRA